jgi:hypothetical protein
MKVSSQKSPSFEMPSVLTARIKRGLTPVATQGWVVQEEDPATALTRALGEWFTELSHNEGLFKKHVHDNEQLNVSDMRQHRARLCALIADGEHLVLDVMILAQKTGAIEETKPIIEMVDQKLKKLFDELFAWHASLDVQTDIPESFKQASREVKEGKIVDLDI